MDDYINIISSVSRQRWGQMRRWPHLHEPKVGHDPGGPPPPPAVASAQNIHLPERALRKPTRKDGPSQNETMLPNRALNNIQLPGHVVRNNRNGPHWGSSRRTPSKKKLLPERIHDNIQQPERATLRLSRRAPSK